MSSIISAEQSSSPSQAQDSVKKNEREEGNNKQAKEEGNKMPNARIELTTHCLQDSSSTIKLIWQHRRCNIKKGD